MSYEIRLCELTSISKESVAHQIEKYRLKTNVKKAQKGKMRND